MADPCGDATQDLVYLAPSKIDRNGVFARRDIQEGEILTIYPEHARRTPALGGGSTTTGANIPEKIWNDYAITIGDGIKLVAHPDHRSKGLGHLINDGIGPEDFLPYLLTSSLQEKVDNPEVSISEAVMLSDIEKTISPNVHNNVKFKLDEKSGQVIVIATRDIKKDSELLVFYGVKYWLSWILRNMN